MSVILSATATGMGERFWIWYVTVRGELEKISSCRSWASMRTSSSRARARRGSFMSRRAASALKDPRSESAVTARNCNGEDFMAPSEGRSIDLQHCQKGLLRNLHLSHPLHPFLTFFLLLQKF